MSRFDTEKFSETQGTRTGGASINEQEEKRSVRETLLEIDISRVARCIETLSNAVSSYMASDERSKAGSESRRSISKTFLDTDVSKPAANVAKNRSISKTLIETDIPRAGEEGALSSGTEPPHTEPSEENKQESAVRRKTSKTLLEVETESGVASRCEEPSVVSQSEEVHSECVSRSTLLEDGIPYPAENDETSQRSMSRRVSVAKTMLDKDLICSQLSASMERQVKIAEEQSASQKLKACQPIVDFNVASSCPWRWDDPFDRCRVAVCGKCSLQVYNFEGMELPDAQQLIFHRENIENAKLFRREDGKYMTRDCPIAAKKKRAVPLLVASGTIVLVSVVIAFILIFQSSRTGSTESTLNPDEDKTTAMRQSELLPTSATSSIGSGRADEKMSASELEVTSLGSKKFRFSKKDGAYHWQAGQPEPQMESTSPSTPTETQTTSSSPYGDESGQFWQYSH